MTLKHNVRENYQVEAAEIFSFVADALKKSFGPYGSTTVIEKNGMYHFSKDGWTILKNMIFGDHFGRSIHQLLVEICSQVVVKVGDGSTSSIIAAHQLYKALQAADTTRIRPKDLMDRLTEVTELIVSRIEQLSTPLDVESDDVHRIAYVSTNGNEEVASMIQNIYRETKNSSIEYIKSGRPKTGYEVVEGYRAEISLLDQIFATNDKGEALVDHPLLLVVDNEMDKDHHGEILSLAKAAARSLSRRLVVISPRYDRLLKEAIAQECNQQVRTNGYPEVIYTRASVVNKDLLLQYNDFAMMAGATMIDYAFIQEFEELIYTDEGDKRVKQITNEAIEKVASALGRAEELIISSDRFATLKGFTNRNEDLYQITIRSAKKEVQDQIDLHRELNTVNIDLYKAQIRLSKLNGKMGIIHVGGSSPLERDASYDLIEDAVKACESATRHGYNLGGNLIIAKAILQLKEEGGIDEVTEMLLDVVFKSFQSVYYAVLENAYQGTKIDFNYEETFNTSIEKGMCYNLIKEDYDSDVINSSEGDIEVLKASLSIVSLILTSNQYLSNAPEAYAAH